MGVKVPAVKRSELNSEYKMKAMGKTRGSVLSRAGLALNGAERL